MGNSHRTDGSQDRTCRKQIDERSGGGDRLVGSPRWKWRETLCNTCHIGLGSWELGIGLGGTALNSEENIVSTVDIQLWVTYRQVLKVH
jgi:hypothetical protein